jgi:hypothetical protein
LPAPSDPDRFAKDLVAASGRGSTVDHMRWVLCAIVWLAMIPAVFWLTEKIEWGPILWTVSSEHALEVSDIVAAILGVAVATAVTVIIWATSPHGDPAAAWVRWGLCALIWVVAICVALFEASQVRSGPVVVRLSDQHEVRLSDMAILFLASAFAATITGVAWLTSRSRPTTRT